MPYFNRDPKRNHNFDNHTYKDQHNTDSGGEVPICSRGPYMGDCQNYGPLLDPYSNTAPDIQGTQKGTIILTTAHIHFPLLGTVL